LAGKAFAHAALEFRIHRGKLMFVHDAGVYQPWVFGRGGTSEPLV